MSSVAKQKFDAACEALAGLWIAWTPKGRKIVAAERTHAECEAAYIRAGYRIWDVIVERVPADPCPPGPIPTKPRREPEPPKELWGLWCYEAGLWLDFNDLDFGIIGPMTFSSLKTAEKIAARELEKGNVLVPVLIGVAPPATVSR